MLSCFLDASLLVANEISLEFLEGGVKGARKHTLTEGFWEPIFNPHIIPDEVPNMFRFLRWSAHFSQIFQNARRSRARVGASAWVGVGVGVRVGVGVGVGIRVGVRVGAGLGRRPLAI